MKLRNPTLIRGLGFAGAWALKAWLSTLRVREDTAASGGIPLHPRHGRFVYVFWHEHILFGTRYGAKCEVLVSKHADGELITQTILHMGMRPVRGSSRRGGTGAVLDMIRRNRRTHIALTPDGPRGPRRQVQAGAIFLASKTGLPIVPIGFGYESAWRARSWDQFAIPKPYSLATCITLPPIPIPAQLDRAGLEAYRLYVEERLQHVNDDAQAWAECRGRLPKLNQAAPLARSA